MLRSCNLMLLQLLLLLLATSNLCQAAAAVSADSAAAVRGPIVPKYMYVGCFQDHGHRDLSTSVNVPHVTVQKCYQQCDQLGYRYFALQGGHQCHCGNTYGIYGEVSERLCNLRCPGNRDQFCGGSWRNCIYEIEHPLDCVDKIEDPREYSYVGCYGDGNPRDLAKLANHQYMTVRKCYLLCKQMHYGYFGVQAGSHCFCGNTYGLYGRRNERLCDRRCAGNNAQFCGGSGTNAIYRVNPPLCSSIPHKRKQ